MGDLDAVKAALSSVNAVQLRPLARGLGVDVSFFLPGKGPRYLKTETIYQRIAERVTKGLLTLERVANAAAPFIGKAEGENKDMGSKEFGKFGEHAGGFKEKAVGPEVVIINEKGTGEAKPGEGQQEAPEGAGGNGEAEGDGTGEGAEGQGEGQGAEGQQGELAYEKPKPGKGQGEGDEHPLIKVMREFIHANAAKPGEGAKQEVEHVFKIKDEVKGKVSGLVHEAFEAVMARAVAGVPVLMVGPAGSGKTHLAGSVAKALNREFVFDSFSPGVGEGKLEGRLLPIEAGGKFVYVSSKFVDAYEKGWCYLADEVDNADPSTISVLNAALANGHMSVPSRTENRVATRHADFVFMAAANTYGNGADRVYVGRNQLDGATLDRFRMGTVDIKYDKRLEKSIEVKLPGGKNVGPVPKAILEWGWKVRELVQKHKLRRICSMRNMLDAAKLEAVGLTAKEWRASFYADWSTDDLAKLPEEVK